MKTDPFSVWSWSVGGSGVVGRSGGNAAEVSAFESVAVALEGDDRGVVDQPSIMAAATTSSPKTSPQRPKGLLEVTSRLARS